MLTQAIKILEYVNIAITLLFLCFYIFRFIALRHFSVTERYRCKYPKARFVLCGIYCTLSVPFLALSILYGVSTQAGTEFWIIEEGVGEFVDAIILVIQCFVLRDELSKERPYTVIHVVYSIYLAALGVARLVVVVVEDQHYNTKNVIEISFYVGFLVAALLILGFWVFKRQELPQFEDNKYFSFDEFRNSRYLINRNIEISYLRKISESFHYIHPIVSVEKGRFRVVLEIYEGPPEETELVERDSRPVSSPQRPSRIDPSRDLRIISNKLYTSSEILELYKICGRFDIKQKINFGQGNIVELYQSLQSYLEELFAEKKHYMRMVLGFFQIAPEVMENFQRELRATIKGSELDMATNLDSDAAFISIKIYKQLWVDDHYLFYMDVMAMDGSFESRPMKRYTDFETLQQKLNQIIKRRYGKFLLPELPKKYLFNWDETKITQRRVELESFMRNLCNDYLIMLEMPQARETLLNFLLSKHVLNIEPQSERAIDLLQGMEVLKGEISKHLVGSEYITFYQLRFVKNGLPLRTVRKRYSDFEALHQSFERHMNNNQVHYKFITLPEKHLHKSGQVRHEKLRGYMASLLAVPDAWKVYDLIAFIHLDSSFEELDFSGIRGPSHGSMHNSPNLIDDSQDIEEVRNKRLVEASSISSNQRMSALIDELGG